MASSSEPERRLRLLRGARAPDVDAASRAVCSYTNRFGVRYYLHETVSKNGLTRYVARRAISDGALSAMPERFEFGESLGGMVSVRRVRMPNRVPMEDFEFVRAAVDRHRHLREHIVERCPGRITIHEPDPEPESWGRSRRLADSEFRVPPRANQPRVRPVLSFVLVGEPANGRAGLYEARGRRDEFDLRGSCFGEGRLEDLVARFVDDPDSSPLG